MFEDAEDGVQELAHDRDQGLQFCFAASEQTVIESAQVGIMPDRDQGGHIEGATQVAVSGLADAGLSAHGGAGGVLARIEASHRDPLPNVQIVRQTAQFGQQRNGDLNGPLLVVGGRIHRPVVADADVNFENGSFAVRHVIHPANGPSSSAPGSGRVLFSYIVIASRGEG